MMKKYYIIHTAFLVLFSMTLNIVSSEAVSKTPLIDAIKAGKPIDAPMVTLKSLEERDNKGATPLLAAAARGNNRSCMIIIDRARQLSCLRNLINTPDHSGFTPLMSAADQGKRKLVGRLVEAGADIDATRSNSTTTAIGYAVRSAHQDPNDRVRLALELAKRSKTPLIAAIRACLPVSAEMVTLKSLEEKDNKGATPLLAALSEGDDRSCMIIIDRARQLSCLRNLINTPDHSGFTPLMSAADQGKRKLVGRLVEAGADIDATRSNSTTTAIGYAVRSAHQDPNDRVRLALELAKRSKTPLIAAIRACLPVSAEMVTLKSLEEKDNKGATPLLAALSEGDDKAASLIMNQAKQLSSLESLVNTPDHSGFTPLLCVSVQGNINIVGRLVEAGADIDATSSTSRMTPLDFAMTLLNFPPTWLPSGRGLTRLGVALILIEAGADVNSSSGPSELPLVIAMKSNFSLLAKELIKAGADVESALAQVPGRQSLTPQQKQRLLALEQEVRNETARAIFTTRTDIPQEISYLIADQLFPGVRTK